MRANFPIMDRGDPFTTIGAIVTVDLRSLVLRTARLVLRPWRRSDLDTMAAWSPLLDPLEQTWNWTQQLAGTSLDLFFAAHQFDTAQHIWTILRDDTIIGILILQTRDPQAPVLGISLDSSAIGQGYGGEALRAFFTSYFAHWPTSTMHLEVALANRRAVRLYTALHFDEQKRYWRDAGTPQRYAFLSQTQYDDMRPMFRFTNTACYQLCATMTLPATTWKRFVV